MFCRMFVKVGLSDVFVIVRLGLWVLRRPVPFSYYIRGYMTPKCHITVDVNFDHWVEVMFARFFNWKVNIFPLSYSIH